MKRYFHWIILLILPVLAAIDLYYELENYGRVTHSDAALAVQLAVFVCMVLVFIIWKKNRKEHWLYTVLAVFSFVMLAVIGHIGGKIPFCVECDHVTAEELGFLTHWITPWESAS
ncbi:MAG: hypothetical protein E7337_11625 [Clostridiales bacterium]|nr:hypothetical protein [Clostridiales bacterium]